MRHGVTEPRVRHLAAAVGVDRRTALLLGYREAGLTYIIEARMGKFVKTEAQTDVEAFATVQQLREEGFDVNITLNGKPVSIGKQSKATA
jgi:hypothetical protein